jgi:hypothetical protein
LFDLPAGLDASELMRDPLAADRKLDQWLQEELLGGGAIDGGGHGSRQAARATAGHHDGRRRY